MFEFTVTFAVLFVLIVELQLYGAVPPLDKLVIVIVVIPTAKVLVGKVPDPDIPAVKVIVAVLPVEDVAPDKL